MALVMRQFGFSSVAVPCIIGTILVVGVRLIKRQTPLPRYAWANPIALSMIVWLLAGLWSLTTPANTNPNMIELMRGSVLQHFYFALLPLYVFSCGPSKPQQVVLAYSCAMSLGMINAGLAFWDGLQKHFLLPAGDFDPIGWHKNTIGDDCSMLLVLAFCVLISGWRHGAKSLGCVPFGLGMLGLFATQARGATLGGIIAIFGVLINKRVHWAKLLLAATLIVVAVFAVGRALPQETVENSLDTKDNSSFAARPRYWSMAFDYLENHNWRPLGWGQPLMIEGEPLDYCNYEFLELAQAGPVAALACVFNVVYAIFLGFRNGRRVRQNSSLQFINNCALAILLERFVHGQVDSFNMIDAAIFYGSMGVMIFVNRCLDFEHQKQFERYAS
jgi:O-antigen ligase